MKKPQSTTHKAPRRKPDPKPVIPYPQTPDTALNHIRLHGLCVSELSRRFQISRFAFVDLLRGQAKGFRGDSHRAAIVLGLKPEPTSKPTK